MGNVKFELTLLVYANKAKTTPYDLTGFDARGAISTLAGAPLQDMICTIVQDSEQTLVYGYIDTATVLTLPQDSGMLYDISVDNDDTGASFCLITGIVTLKRGASAP